MNNHIFISYSRKDVDVMAQLRENLEAAGQEVWTDEKIKLGEDWQKSIERAIKDSNLVLAILSENSNQSEWIQSEIEASRRYGKYIVPFVISGNPNPLPQTSMLIDARGNFELAVKNLLNALEVMEGAK